MANWFETKITHKEVQQDGKLKKVTDAFLVQAETFTEAEARTIEERAPFLNGDFSIKSAKRTKITEIINNPYLIGANWYQVKWSLITLDEGTGVEKRVNAYAMVEAYGVSTAIARFNDYMKGSIVDYEIVAVAETPIHKVYPIKVKQQEDGNED